MENLTSLNQVAVDASAIPQIAENATERNQWIQLLPKGPVVKCKDNRGPYSIKDAAKVIEHSFHQSGNEMLPIDYNHAIDIAEANGAKTPAAGWIKRMEVRESGIWGLAEWTPTAFVEIKNRDFRFISPVLVHTPDYQIVGILRASLTNNPALTMIALNAAQQGNTMNETQFLTEARRKLALDENSGFDIILAQIDKLLTSKNCADPTKYVPIDVFQDTVAELNKLDAGMSQLEAEHVVERTIENGQLLPFMRNWAVSLCTVNRPAFDEFLNGAGKPVKKFVDDLMKPAIDVAKMQALDLSRSNSGHDEISKNLGLSPDDVAKYSGKENAQ